ncbi:MAG: alpha-hydroxy-acid oxidizing protein [candidate division Zixibacteria bacterium]|nr:alpha-hydroxy-acid oxidizing protein [candidate division Zixibacteria bacterium]
MQVYPAVADLQRRAQKRIPHVAWEYLDMGTGDERAVARNIERMAEVLLVPRFMKGELKPDLTTSLFGKTYAAPFGVAPVGLSGLMWPEAEKLLAAAAARCRIPYCLSTVATQTPETVGPLAGDMAWFQLYTPRDREVRNDVLARARVSGFDTLVVTADVPAGSRRERAARAGLRMPPRITPRFVYEAMIHPLWTAQTLKAGLPRLRTMEKYAEAKDWATVSSFIGRRVGGTLSWDDLKEMRDTWSGPLVLKGVVHPEDAEIAVGIGVDGVYVSNHGARQLDAVPAAIDSLPVIARQVNGRASILFDSGVRTGLDVIRALSLGADFVLLGRPFLYGAAALGTYGGDHVAEILKAEMIADMHQLGYARLSEIETPDRRLYTPDKPYHASDLKTQTP